MEKVRIGVIGAGHLGYLHIVNLKEIEEAELVGFYDVDRERADYVARKTGVRSFENLDSLFESCDAASIVVPTQSHYKVALRAIECGVHFFCEKPFMESVEQAEDIITRIREKGIIAQVGHIERFNPALKHLRDEITNPLFIESHRIAPFNPRGTDVAVILDLMIHDIDIILYLVKAKVKTISATGAPVLTANIDIANARIEFENGCVANVTASRVSQKKMRKMRIFQKSKYISINFLDREAEVYWLDRGNMQHPRDAFAVQLPEVSGCERNIFYKKISIPDGNPLREELRAFIKAVRGEMLPPVTAEEGKEALRVAVEIENQIKENLKRIL